MSLVLSTELADPSYRNAKLYTLKGTDVTLTPDLSSHNFAPDKHRSMYMTTESYSSESYEKYFLDLPTGELVEPSSSSISGTSVIVSNPFDSSIWSTRDAYQSNSEDASPDGLDFDGEMRLKLQELERALFSDDEEEEEGMFETVQSMEIDPPGMDEWVNPSSTSVKVKDKIEYISRRRPSCELAFEVELGPNPHSKLLRGSPKESSSSDSSSDLSSISSTTTKDAPQTPKQLLYECARVLSEGNENEAVSMINKLRQMVSIQGDPSQRIAAYMVEGLAARLATSGKCIYKALRCKEPPSNDRLAAMQILFEVCPCFKFGYIAANGAIAEAVRDEKKVHIVDFDICQGTQYIALIQTLASMPGRPPRVRLTAVDDPESVQRSVGGIRVIGQRLEKLAEELGLPFEFRAVASSTSIVTPSMLNCRGSEAEEVLVVNFAFQLHHMRDETVSTVNERDQLLRMVKSLNPKLVTVVEQDMNTNTSPFLQRFVEAYNYYSAVFDTLDATLPRESQDRMNVERQCLAKDIVNIVACEGEERIERYEVAGKWRARLSMAGFSPSPMSTNVREAIRKLIVKQYCERFKVKEEMEGLHFGWDDKTLVVASAWK